jgi:pimeloyl-ACP methyl ester carboxylesterase
MLADDDGDVYRPRRVARSRFVRVRHLDYHVLTWGEPQAGKVPLVLAHGWMDVAASYQFVVDAFADDRYVIAPDWRGHGLTEAPATDTFWFTDYLADLDFLLDHFSPDAPVDLVGHSLGGNVVMMYAGTRPGRVRRLVNVEGFGGPAPAPAQVPGRQAQWMDELKALHRGEIALKSYADRNGVVERLMKTNPRLPRDKAQWLADRWARREGDGSWHILGHPALKLVRLPVLRVDELLETYRLIRAPTLSVEAGDNTLLKLGGGAFTLEDYHDRLRAVATCRIARVEDAGHMLHHDQPARLARLIEDFLADG